LTGDKPLVEGVKMFVKSSVEAFVGTANLPNGTGFHLVITSLQGTELKGHWERDTDLYLLTVIQSRRTCIWKPTPWPEPYRFEEQMGMSASDAEHLDKWLKDNFPKS
jgi:hypothetical protein